MGDQQWDSDLDRQRQHQAATEAAMARFAEAAGVRPRVRVVHYHGGPCEPEEIQWCIIPGGTGLGWTVTGTLDEALRLGDRLAGESVEDKKMPVLVFWGDARWTRAQLLGEMAKGVWGLCQALRDDFEAAPEEVWTKCEERVVFAPRSEMTSQFIGGNKESKEQTPEEQMQRLHTQIAAHRDTMRLQQERQHQHESKYLEQQQQHVQDQQHQQSARLEPTGKQQGEFSSKPFDDGAIQRRLPLYNLLILAQVAWVSFVLAWIGCAGKFYIFLQPARGLQAPLMDT